MAAARAAGRLVWCASGSRPPPLVLLADVISCEEEARLAAQLIPPLSRRNYRRAHFDGVIEGYRELERPLSWFEPSNRTTLKRVLDIAFGPGSLPPLLSPHVLELAPGTEGIIRPHIDNVSASGTAIAGLSLLSDAVMQLTHKDEPERTVRLFLRARSLYVLRDEARYCWKHAILPDLCSFPPELRTEQLPTGAHEKGRRIAVVFRDELHSKDTPQPGGGGTLTATATRSGATFKREPSGEVADTLTHQ